ncbi:MAG: hypothetical protein ACF8NJ_08485 [Phycisphaerales bacterium JB038]
MATKIDPVDRALDTLGSRQWSAPPEHQQLEGRIMQHLNARQASPLGRHRTALAALAVLALVSVGFGAGVLVGKSLRVTTAVNGQVVDTRDITLDENGAASFSVPLDGDIGGEVAEVSMTFDGETVGPEGTAVIDISADGADNALDVEITTEEDGE